MTAELAIALPAAVLVLAACLGGLRLGVERLQVTDEAARQARAAARGEALPADGPVAVRRDGDLVCVEARRTVPLLGLPVPVSATACSLPGVVR